MIPVLYKADATDFTTFGIGALADTISCEVTEERNSIYECKMKYPITGNFYAEIRKERLIKAKPNDTSAEQAFRIYRITKPLNGIVTIYAQRLSYDLATIATPAWTSAPITPQIAIEHVFENALTPHRFTFRTDYTEAKEFAVSKPKSLRSVLGGSAGSLVSLWGGEFEWDNYIGTWTTSSSISVSSDARIKNSLEELPDKYSILFDALSPKRFKYNDGKSGRYHTGFIAQDVKASMDTAKVDASEFAGLCIAKTDDGEEWSLRYEEFIAINTREIQKLKAEIKSLKEQIGGSR